MAGVPLASFGLVDKPYDHIAVKEAVFPFARFAGVDTILGPEMRSTGEVMGLDWKRDGEADMAPAFARAFAKSQIGGGTTLPDRRLRLRLGQGRRQALHHRGRAACCWPRASRSSPPAAPTPIWSNRAWPVGHVKKVLEGRPHIVDAMKNGEVQLVFNTTEGKQSLQDSFSLRRTALMMKIPYYTTTAGALAAAQAIGAIKADALEVRPIQGYALDKFPGDPDAQGLSRRRPAVGDLARLGVGPDTVVPAAHHRVRRT